MELKTPLYDCHVACKGKIVPFAGYLLPVQYETGVITEHMAVRTKAGLFDVSHMGETLFFGKDALANIQKLVTNDCTGMYDGQARYSPMCNGEGGVVDDLIVYRMSEEKYMIVVNAANRHKDVQWMQSHLFGDVTFQDVSDDFAQIALQGPKSQEILQKLAVPESIPLKYYSCVEHGVAAGIPCIVSKTGYTGEDGFELYCASQDAPALWNALLKAGEEYGLIPCGLGARDTLRLEAAMPLYGHEMDDGITPLETGLGFAVKMQKEDFIGKKALVEKGIPTKKRVGIRMTGRGIAREHCDVYAGEKQIGHTTSGTFCPFLGYAAAMALIEADSAVLGSAVQIDVRGKKIEAEIVKLPFYKKP
jgi:aminomethyltransferase